MKDGVAVNYEYKLLKGEASLNVASKFFFMKKENSRGIISISKIWDDAS